MKRYRPINKSKAIKLASSPAQRLALFGPPLLLEGEDAAAYDELLARVYAAVKPVDTIDEIFINDVVVLQWEILRWRRLKLSLMSARVLAALESFLDPVVLLYADDLIEAVRESLGKDQNKEFAKLACAWERNEPDAEAKVDAFLTAAGLESDIVDRIEREKTKKLVESYSRREPWAVEEVQEFLDAAGRTMDGLVAKALEPELDNMERLDRLITIAETRRNASLKEIDRRRTTLGQVLRQSVQEVEDAEFNEIEATPAKGKSAA
jgi:hypothetical protein